jgi:hypothetical protein
MPSTYSPNLRIELIASGEQANTWGITTNNNLGTLIEQSIAGLVSIDVTGSDVTLTALDGASDESRNMILDVFGTAGTTRYVYAPAVSKVYVVNNGSDDTVVIAITGGPLAGYSIPSGSAVLVYTDGIGFYAATGDSLPITGGTLTGPLYGTSADFTDFSTFTGGALVENVDASGLALRVIPSVSGTQGIIQWTNHAQSAAWTSLIGTSALLTCTTNFTSSGQLGGATLNVSGTGTINNLNVSTSLGVGVSASGSAGDVRAIGNVTAYYSSDARLKENIQPIEDALLLIEHISGVRYDWTDDFVEQSGGEDGYFIRKNDIGLIAQEVQSILPEAVAEKPDGYLGVQYDKVIPLLVECIKDLSAKVAKLEAAHGNE